MSVPLLGFVNRLLMTTTVLHLSDKRKLFKTELTPIIQNYSQMSHSQLFTRNHFDKTC